MRGTGILINDEYSIYEDKGKIGFGLGIVFNFLLLSVFLFLYKYVKDYKYKVYFNLSLISFFLIPFSLQLEIVARLGYYFEVFTIITYPKIFQLLRIKSWKLIFILSIFIFKIYNFFIFFFSPVTHDYYFFYTTIFNNFR